MATYYGTLKKAWFIEGYTLDGATLCRKCASNRTGVEGLIDPYTLEVVENCSPIFASDFDGRLWCEACDLIANSECAFPEYCDRCN